MVKHAFLRANRERASDDQLRAIVTRVVEGEDPRFLIASILTNDEEFQAYAEKGSAAFKDMGLSENALEFLRGIFSEISRRGNEYLPENIIPSAENSVIKAIIRADEKRVLRDFRTTLRTSGKEYLEFLFNEKSDLSKERELRRSLAADRLYEELTGIPVFQGNETYGTKSLFYKRPKGSFREIVMKDDLLENLAGIRERGMPANRGEITGRIATLKRRIVEYAAGSAAPAFKERPDDNIVDPVHTSRDGIAYQMIGDGRATLNPDKMSIEGVLKGKRYAHILGDPESDIQRLNKAFMGAGHMRMSKMNRHMRDILGVLDGGTVQAVNSFPLKAFEARLEEADAAGGAMKQQVYGDLEYFADFIGFHFSGPDNAGMRRMMKEVHNVPWQAAIGGTPESKAKMQEIADIAEAMKDNPEMKGDYNELRAVVSLKELQWEKPYHAQVAMKRLDDFAGITGMDVKIVATAFGAAGVTAEDLTESKEFRKYLMNLPKDGDPVKLLSGAVSTVLEEKVAMSQVVDNPFENGGPDAEQTQNAQRTFDPFARIREWFTKEPNEDNSPDGPGH